MNNLITKMEKNNIVIGIIGMGYVGLPLAVEFGKKYATIGFDINANRIKELKSGKDSTLEVEPEELKKVTNLQYTSEPDQIAGCDVYIVTVPTPIDEFKQPDLRPLKSASLTVGKVLNQGNIVIYESTVYPGATEEVCVPILENESGDFSGGGGIANLLIEGDFPEPPIFGNMTMPDILI